MWVSDPLRAVLESTIIANGKCKRLIGPFSFDHAKYCRRTEVDKMRFGQWCVGFRDVIVGLRAIFLVAGLGIWLTISHTMTKYLIILAVPERKEDRIRLRDFARVLGVNLSGE